MIFEKFKLNRHLKNTSSKLADYCKIMLLCCKNWQIIAKRFHFLFHPHVPDDMTTTFIIFNGISLLQLPFSKPDLEFKARKACIFTTASPSNLTFHLLKKHVNSRDAQKWLKMKFEWFFLFRKAADKSSLRLKLFKGEISMDFSFFFVFLIDIKQDKRKAFIAIELFINCFVI